MKTAQTFYDIAVACSLRGNISPKEITTHLNSYLSTDLLSDLPIFNLRNAVTFSGISRFSDCYIPDNTKVRAVRQIKSKISSLEMPLYNYTNRRVYAPMSDSIRQTPSMLNISITERESDFFSNGFIRILARGTVNNRSPYALDHISLRNLSNYWTRVKILYDEKIVASMVFSKIIRAKYSEDSGFSSAIDYKNRTLTVQYNSIDPRQFVVIVESFRSQFSMLIDGNCIFGSRAYTGYNQASSELFVDCYEFPTLLADENDIIDPKLNRINKIIVMGTAKNISYIYANNLLQESIQKNYLAFLDAYKNVEAEKDMLEFTRSRQIRDPLSNGLNYRTLYPYGFGSQWGI